MFHDWNLYASNSASSFSLCCSSYNSFICSTFHKMSTTSTKFRQHAENFQNLLSRCKQNQKLLDKMTITFGAHLFDSFSQVWKPFNIPLNKTLHCYWRHLHSCPFTFYGWVHNAYCPRPCLFRHAKFPEALLLTASVLYKCLTHWHCQSFLPPENFDNMQTLP